MRIVLCALLALLVSQQQPPPKAASNQQRPDSSARKTQSTPVTIRLDSAQAETYAKRAEQERREKATTDTNIVRLTAGLLLVGFFQLLLFGWQLWIMGESLADTKHAANAAKDAAYAARESLDSYRRSERAWLSYMAFEITEFDGTDATTGKPMRGTSFGMQWVNAGRTPAIHCRIATAHRIMSVGDDVPTFAVPPGPEEQATALIPGIPVSSPPRFIARPDVQRLMERKCRIFIYAQADYALVFPQDTRPDSSPRTEVCLEVQFEGTDVPTGKPRYTFTPRGPQNSAR